MSGNIEKILSDNINETPSQRRLESKNVLLNHGDRRNHQTPASSEEWAEVLATADKYY